MKFYNTKKNPTCGRIFLRVDISVRQKQLYNYLDSIAYPN